MSYADHAAIERVERLHRLVEDPAGDCCAECDQPFPCATRLAIDETGPPADNLYTEWEFQEDQKLIDAACYIRPPLRITPEQALMARMNLNVALFLATETECATCVRMLRTSAMEAAGLDPKALSHVDS